MGPMTPSDLEACRNVIKALTSEKYKGKNYLFLQPFDLSQTPGYMDVVTKLMDLSTLSKNLEAGAYSSRSSFFKDCFTIFENAIAYHANRDSKWIAKLAKDMLKIAQKQQQKLSGGGKTSSGGGSGTGGDGSSKKSSVGLLPTKKNKKLLSEGGTKLKLKIGGPSSGSKSPTPSSSAVPASAPSKPKVSIKLKAPSQGKVPPPGAQSQPAVSSSSTEEKKPKKPRLTLKLGKPKDSSSPTPDMASKQTPKQSPKPASAPSPKITPKQKPTTASASAKSTSSTPKSTTSSSSDKAPVKVVGGGGSRGKELPEGVSPPKPEPKKSTKKSTTKKATAKTVAKAATPKTSAKIKAKTPGAATTTDGDKSKSATKIKLTKNKTKGKLTLKTSSSTGMGGYGSLPMTAARKSQASKVLNGLKRRQYKNIGWFTQPVSDKAIIQDYRAKIKYPMDLNTMQTKLEKNEYQSIGSFVLDLRRIFANCVKYNTSVKDDLRSIAVNVLTTAEQVLSVFVAKPEHPSPVYPPLLFCWKLCLSVLDTLNNLSNPADGNPTAYYFLHPVSFYCGGQFPPDYLEKVTKPMDFGTVTSQLLEGHYTRTEDFQADCKLVLENCTAYYGGKEDGKVFVEQANRLKDVLQQQLDALNRYIKSSAGESVRKQALTAVSSFSFPKPPIPLMLGIVEELRALKYTDKATKITEPAMAPFEKPVSTAAFPDYLQIVKTPMDLQTILSKVKTASYANPEDFEHDMITIFQNCVTYNGARKTDHLVAMGKYGMKHFRKIFASKMKAFDDPSSVPSPKDSAPKDASRKSTPDTSSSQGPSKKLKLDSGVSRGKTAARSNSAQSGSVEKTMQAPRPKASKATTTVPKSKPNQPVPLHIAIAQVKEQFKFRRAVKTLQSWEAGCARFFKELMRHSWISAARPKFIFHVPVPVLFPELREAYAMKVKKPMDLTTVECALLAGNRYASPEAFISDVALVFSNAIKFNKDGRDIGDPLSCAYYDASIHLLRYSRWLSLELLSDSVVDSDAVDEVPEHSVMPLSSWKLTEGNRKRAREEMEIIVLKEPIEKSLEGDRYTWMEAECEKLLKALRHQSDLRHMQFFIQPNYPPDYAAFIAKPMDWKQCEKTLKKRHYDKFGDVIDDLRLIFSNALKYNARHAGTDTVSGQAFNAAKYMSAKLEVAINKMMLTVSDRLERERIDHNNAEREIEAAERAEEERIRAKWKNESAGGNTRVESTQRVQSSKRNVTSRENTDFEVPFFDDEDDGQHERSYFEVVRQQKAMFERQRQGLSKMQQSATNLGSATFLRSMQRELALKWVAEERKKLGIKGSSPTKASKKDDTEATNGAASSVLSKLEESGRKPMQLKLSKPKLKKKSSTRKQPLLDFGGDGDDDDGDEVMTNA